MNRCEKDRQTDNIAKYYLLERKRKCKRILGFFAIKLNKET
jgi:hypothetical protein